MESSNIQLRVGVAQTPLQPEDDSRWNNSWCIQTDTGDLHRNSEQTDSNLLTLTQGDTLTIEYNVPSRLLQFGKNSDELKKAFEQVVVDGKDISPFVHFLNTDGPRKVCCHFLKVV